MSTRFSRHEIVTYYLRLHDSGLNDSHSGNISGRKEQAFWITPSGAGAETLAAADLIKCPVDGPLGAGASLDGALHQAVYRALPEAGAVIHSHGPYSIAMTLDGSDFRPLDFEGEYYFDTVPVLDIAFDRYTADSPAAIAAALRQVPVAIVRGHGVYARGRGLDEAYKWSRSLESSARIAWLARNAGVRAPGTPR